MKYLVIPMFAILALSCENSSRTTQNTISSTFDFENTEKYEGEISDVVEKLWKDGYPNKDTVLVDDLYHAQFNLVDDEGTIYTKEKELTYIAEYGDQYQNFNYTIESVSFYENGTAVAFTRCRFMGQDGQGAFATNYVQTLTLSSLNGSWKILYSQVSGVREERIPMANQ